MSQVSQNLHVLPNAHPIQPSALCVHQEGVTEGESKEGEVRLGNDDKVEKEEEEEGVAAGWQGRALAVDRQARSTRMFNLLAPINERHVTRVAEKHGAPPSPEGDDNVEAISAQAFGDVAAECSHDWRLPRVLTPRRLYCNDEHAEHGQQTLVQTDTHSSELISPLENTESEVSLLRRGGGEEGGGGGGLAHENKESEVSALPPLDSEDTASESEHNYLTSQEIQHMHERVHEWLSSAPPPDDHALVAQSSYSGKDGASPVHSHPIHYVPVQMEVSQGIEDVRGCEGQEEEAAEAAEAAEGGGEEGVDCHGMGMEARILSSEETLVNSPPYASLEHTVREGKGERHEMGCEDSVARGARYTSFGVLKPLSRLEFTQARAQQTHAHSVCV